ncbi:hypothetical protein AAG570_007468 [Ranatra chinensis]|uniref:Oxidation resistance protein 1 n=1 Tax=Ranatra chinensis TaxID=642074 RepID=A0ABD0YB38_9HEMI
MASKRRNIVKILWQADKWLHGLFQQLWVGMLTPRLCHMLIGQAFLGARGRPPRMSAKRMARTYAAMARGGRGRRAESLLRMSTPLHKERGTIATITLYLKELWSSYLKLLVHLKNEPICRWADAGVTNFAEDVTGFVKYLVDDLEHYEDEVIQVGAVEAWLARTTIHDHLMDTVIEAIYNVRMPSMSEGLFPQPLMTSGCTTFLGLTHVGFLNWALNSGADSTWVLLYSSSCRQDWDDFLEAIVGRGATLLLVRDADGLVFGFYASQSWHPAPSFYGDKNCFLFTLRPEMNKFEATGYNSNYQYINADDANLPKGLGAGGRIGHWGMFLDWKLCLGRVSRTCSTFRGYSPLTVCQTFRITGLEVWSTGGTTQEEDGVRAEVLVAPVHAKETLRSLVGVVENPQVVP